MKTIQNRRVTGVAYSVLAAQLLMGWSGAAKAQVLNGDDIVVTAQRREQSAQDVGIAVSALSGKQLQDLGVDQLTDISLYIPGVSNSASFAGQFQAFSIRGVTQSDILDTTEAPNAVYIDDGYIAAINGQGLLMFDVDAVEVLKGPQGTLFGRNATGGAINVRSRLPGDKLNGYANFRIGRYGQLHTEAAVGGPISDKVSLRLAAVYERQGNFVHNIFPGGTDEGAYNRFGLRATAELRPTDDLTVTLRGYYTKSRMNTPTYFSRPVSSVRDANGLLQDIVVTPFPTGLGNGDSNAGKYFWTVSHDFSGKNLNTLRQYGFTGKIEWKLADALTLTSVTNYSNFSKRFFLDSDGSEVPFLDTINFADTKTLTEEMRLFGNFGRWRLNAGVYYLNIDNHVPNQSLDLPLFGVVLSDVVDLQTRSYSAFVQPEFDLTDKLTFIAGLRYTRENKAFNYDSNTYVAPATPTDLRGPFLAHNRSFADKRGEDLYSIRAALNYHLTNDVLLYTSFNRGVKAGSFNAPFGGSPIVLDANIPYKSEVLYAYEAGIKSELFDRRVRFNLSAFHYDYRNYQAFRVTGITTEVVNTNANYSGLEADLNLRLGESFSAFFSGSYIHTKVKNIAIDGVVADRKAAFTPDVSGSAVLRYERGASFGKIGGQVEMNYRGSFYWNIANFSSQKVKDYAILNARLFLKTDDEHWNFSVYADNLTNQHNVTVGFDFPDLCGCGIISYGMPLTFGVGAGYKF